MTIQYNVPIKVLNSMSEYKIQDALGQQGIPADMGGSLEKTCLSKEEFPYIGELIVIKTLKKEIADTAYKVLFGIEDLLVLPITECNWEDDRERVAELEMAGIKGAARII
mgnify:FL=1